MSGLREVCDGVWVIDHAFSMPGGIQLGLRTSIIRLPDGGLWLHSPGPMSADDHEAVRALGRVRALVFPNLFHHFYLLDALAAFPEAKLYTAPGLAEKLGEFPNAIELAVAPPPEWGGAFQMRAAEGMPRLGEVLFLHVASRTLLLGDLAFNVQEGNWFTSVFLRINNVWRRFGPSRLARSMVKDRAALRGSVADVMEHWDFDRVIVTHGDILESGAKQTMRESFAWLLD